MKRRNSIELVKEIYSIRGVRISTDEATKLYNNHYKNLADEDFYYVIKQNVIDHPKYKAENDPQNQF